MQSNYLILCYPLLAEAFSLSQHQCLFQRFSCSHQVTKVLELQRPSKENSGLIAFKIDWFHLLAVQGTLESLLQHHSLKECIMIIFNFPLAHNYLKAGFFFSGAYSISFIIELYMMNVKYF